MTDNQKLERLKGLDRRERDLRTCGVVAIILTSYLLTGTVNLVTGLVILGFMVLCGLVKTFYLKPQIRELEAKISKTV